MRFAVHYNGTPWATAETNGMNSEAWLVDRSGYDVMDIFPASDAPNDVAAAIEKAINWSPRPTRDCPFTVTPA